MKNIFQIATLVILLCSTAACLAATPDASDLNASPDSSLKHPKGPVEERAKKEEKIPPNYFAVTFYKPTYVLPYYYTGSPYNAVYQNNTPHNEKLNNAEIKYQFSLKVPVWKNIFNHGSSIFIAYTQLSYWQAYNHRAFFRESNYEPEIFLTNKINFHLIKKLNINFFNIGLSHQSNGYGNALERSWNRIYAEVILSTGHWMVGIKPWYIISKDANNPDIAKFLGHGQLLVGYKHHKQVFSITAYNIFENSHKKATAEITWSFPITPYIKGYLQFFSGYGQSLIEYNHRTNSAGVGIALSDWV